MPYNTTAWGIGLATSFRNTSSKLFKNWPQECGSNLQNPSDRICEIYIPRDGYIFIQADQAGADARIMAYLMKPGNKLRELYENNIKPHTYLALHLFASYWQSLDNCWNIKSILNSPISTLSKYKEWPAIAKAIKEDKDPRTGFELKYYLGKKSIHSFNYKKMPQTFIFDILKESEGKIVISLEEGKRIYNIYHALIPELNLLFKEQEYILRKCRELRNLQGFPRKFYGTITDKFFREAIAWIPQSTVACINKAGFISIQSYIESSKKKWDLLNEKHDSILMQVPIAEEKEGAIALKNALEQTLLSPYNEQFQMKSEVSSGYNWRKHHDTLNPNGLKEIKI